MCVKRSREGRGRTPALPCPALEPDLDEAEPVARVDPRRIDAGAAVDVLALAVARQQHVGTRAPEQEIGAFAAVDAVVACAAVEDVTTAQPPDDVVAAEAADVVGPSRPDEDVPARRADDRAARATGRERSPDPGETTRCPTARSDRVQLVRVVGVAHER